MHSAARRVAAVAFVCCASFGIVPAIGESLGPVGGWPCPDTIPKGLCMGHQNDVSVWHSGNKLPLQETVGYVQSLLQTAIEVEHSTIPLYLTTMYSILNQSSFEALTMRGVVMEEMLHMTHAANVLNAVGGHPDMDHPDFIPKYPLVLPILNISADIVWFTQDSVQHYEVLESIPPAGYNSSISMAYQHIVNLLTSLCHDHGEAAVFTGNLSLQVNASTSYGQIAAPVTSLETARAALIGVADQGGGCPVTGKMWPKTSSIASGPAGQDNSAEGAEFSHAARYTEIMQGRSYKPGDKIGVPTGENQSIAWGNVRRFAPNPAVSDFLPDQCVDGGSWVVRNESFFVEWVWDQHNHTLDTSIVATWEDCAKKCEAWTVDYDEPLKPCAMWSWVSEDTTIGDIPLTGHTCLLAQGGGPVTKTQTGLVSGCQYGTVCNHTLPGVPLQKKSDTPPPPHLAERCQTIHTQGIEFAGNYTELLVALHNTFNGQPDLLMETIGQMYTLKSSAIELMETPDPRISANTMGIGPPWEYIPHRSQFEARGRKPFPVI